MLVLAIDTSTPAGTACVFEHGGICAEISLSSDVNHSERLLPSIISALKLARKELQEIDLIGYVKGPGSFTGLRIGLGTVKGLAFANRIPIIGVSSLEAVALNIPDTDSVICPMLDARKQEVYCALYRRQNGSLEIIEPEATRDPAAFARKAGRKAVFVGGGAARYKDEIMKATGGRAAFAPDHLGRPHGPVIAAMAAEAFLENGGENLASAAPVYIRKSEAELRLMERLSSLPRRAK